MTSLFHRFGWALSDLPGDSLLRVARNESARVLGPLNVSGRNLFFLDLSSQSLSGTFKDWLACLCVADCLHRGVRHLVTQTSGNTGNSLGIYSQGHDLRLTVFYPAESAHKIFPEVASQPHCRFVEVSGTEPALKQLTSRYANLHGLPWWPTLKHQIEANKLRAYFLEDWCSRQGVSFDWHAQALSSAYGVIGFYQGLRELGRKEPALLGVQQAGRAPFHHPPNLDFHTELLEPTLFRSAPGEFLLSSVAEICERSRGCILLANPSRNVETALELFEQVGLPLQISPATRTIHEKAPLLALLGVLQAIESGRILPGSNVLLAVTGGAGRVPQRAWRATHRFALADPCTDQELIEFGQRLWESG